MIERSARGERTLLGWDFPLGYPRELAALLGVAGARGIWELLARELRDQGNRSNRFDVAAALNARLKSACSSGGPFWGCPARQARDGLTERKPPPAALPEWRLCELALREKGRRPHAVWKLYTAGSCGSQTLTGIPRLLRLRDAPALAAASAIWPFETGFALPAASRIVHVECWPGAVPFQSGAHEVKDAAQMLSLLRWAARLDGKGELAARFGPLGGLSGAQLSRAREEGWILW